MKKIIFPILASALCFTGSLPAFAGQANLGGSNLGGTFGNSDNIRVFDNMSRLKVFITIEGQRLILGELNANSLPILNPLAQSNPAIQDFVFLLTGDKGKVSFNSPEIQKSQSSLIAKLTSLGLDLSDGRPARQLVTALTLLIPFGNNATPSETIGVAAVDGTKFFQAITAWNQLIDGLVITSQGTGPDAVKARAIINALLQDDTAKSIRETLAALRAQLKDRERKEDDK
ncbi:hypothetical protein H6F42_17390 [Pseudanabaena sp. FACHB-1998]|uniref:hypothetical protein n=1 Tax=Pseudanabaena sp. FACHB-1998 TaxID=2692858 RepID=UPI0016809E9F|nr:hypothetical protein [Pseudanabaena sp. FACHB-1998]MBD2178696.1 hypothetical protein [Pseudanabaena sp. FACHB-1998]